MYPKKYCFVLPAKWWLGGSSICGNSCNRGLHETLTAEHVMVLFFGGDLLCYDNSFLEPRRFGGGQRTSTRGAAYTESGMLFL